MTLDELTAQIIADATGAKLSTVEKHFDSIREAMEENVINTPLRIAHFLAQCAHESRRFEATVENLNYSWQALRQHFGRRYFVTDEIAQQYHRQPRRIASRIYANRMGNSDEGSEDGWFHRGAGFIQLTGHDNQIAYWNDRGGGAPWDREKIVEIISTPPHAAKSAGWFWATNHLNTHADRDDTLAVSGTVNVGNPRADATRIIGYSEREDLTEALKAALT